jgi:CheY-like chemotaxis protein
VKILLVEDDDVDVEFFLRGLQKQGFQCTVHVAGNGIEALQILRNSQEEGSRYAAWLVITDLQMPLMNGFEFLRALRSDAAIAPTVTFVLTTSKLAEDKVAAYEACIAGYLLKSDLQQNFSLLIDLLRAYEGLVVLP